MKRLDFLRRFKKALFELVKLFMRNSNDKSVFDKTKQENVTEKKISKKRNLEGEKIIEREKE
jgi:hypothetical protein